jgi:hypothetical protein
MVYQRLENELQTRLRRLREGRQDVLHQLLLTFLLLLREPIDCGDCARTGRL